MGFSRFAILVFLSASITNAASLKDAFSEGTFQGQLRAYNNTLVLQHAGDKYGTAFGGRLGYETKADKLEGFSLGMAYYTANDLGTNHDDPAARAPFTPTVDIDVMGEAFARYSGFDTVVTAGRQLVDTPFANPSDAFLIPVTFTGYSLINKSIKGLTINAHQLLSMKTRESANFVNVGAFATNELGKPAQNTGGTAILGLTYDWEKLKVQAWHYTFTDLFNFEWFQADYELSSGAFTPYVSAQFGSQSGTGAKLLGDVDSTLYGAKAGVKAHGANLSLGVNNVAKNKYYTPYTFFTDATYTNSMITGMGNIDAGTAYKVMLGYDFSDQLWTKLSYSNLHFAGDKAIAEDDLDVRYKFKNDFQNLQAMFRVGYRYGNPTPAGLAELLEYRTQLQYTF